MDHTFQVDLPVLIDLLGRRLHDHPSYFIRDLIQLATDSIRAREALEPDHAGAITIEVLGGKTPTLAFLDSGLGLTEAEAHERLGTIGRSGLGLLSSFAVADEIADNAVAVVLQKLLDGVTDVASADLIVNGCDANF